MIHDSFRSILILHGWGSSSQSWVKVKELLEAQGFKIFVPDLPGFGQEPPPTKAWNLDDYAEWARLYADQHGLDRFFLLGHSFGGGIAAKFASRYQRRLEGLILTAPRGVTPRKNLKNVTFRIVAKIGNLIFSVPFFYPIRSVARKAIYFFAGERDYYKTQGIMREVMKKVLAEDLTSFLPAIFMPTLIVWGSDDTMTPISDAHIFQKNIANSKLVVFEGGKHGLNLQMPEKLTYTITEWVNDMISQKLT